MNVNKVGSVKNADIVLKGEEKEAYLQFVEEGGYAEMRKNIFKDLEKEKGELWEEQHKLSKKEMNIREKMEKLELYSIIRNAIEKMKAPNEDELDGEVLRFNYNFIRGISTTLRLDKKWSYNNRGEIIKYYNELFFEFNEYLLNKKALSEVEKEFDEHYKLLHKNLAKDKLLTEIEYNNKLKKYKNKVRKSFLRRFVLWLTK